MISKLFEGKTDLVEEWYGTEYSVNKIPQKYIEVYAIQLIDRLAYKQTDRQTNRQTDGQTDRQTDFID